MGNIRLYKNTDLESIFNIAYSKWSDELNFSTSLKKIIYNFLVDYYAKENNYTYVFEYSGIIKAFALAQEFNESNKDAVDRFIKRIDNLSTKEKEDGYRYLEYIEKNSNHVKSMLNSDDIYFGLLASNYLGAGNLLINNLKRIAKENNKKSIYFWTDETCDYKYYERKGFTLIKTYTIDFFNKDIKTFVYKIEL